MRRVVIQIDTMKLLTNLTTKMTPLQEVQYEGCGELSLTQRYAISSPQVVSALPDSIRSTVMRLANGQESLLKVVEITPLQVVILVSNGNNSPVITAPTRTRLITSQETSTVSAITATIAGTPPTTLTTTRTSRSSTKPTKKEGSYRKPKPPRR